MLKISNMATWEYYLEQADYFEKEQSWSEAIAAYQKALELNPDLPGIYQKIGDILQQQAASERTHLLNLYQQEIQQNPDNLQTYYQALDIFPKDADVYLGLAKALTKKGRFDQAQLAYQKALQLQPNHPQLQNFNSTQNQTFNPNLISLTNSSLQLDQAKQAVDSLNQITLDSFLNTASQLHFPSVDHPKISIIIILYNRAELTLSCLTSLFRNSFQSFELILVDNNSTDATS